MINLPFLFDNIPPKTVASLVTSISQENGFKTAPVNNEQTMFYITKNETNKIFGQYKKFFLTNSVIKVIFHTNNICILLLLWLFDMIIGYELKINKSLKTGAKI